MFVDAIERVNLFTRPLHSIIRLYGHDVIEKGTATLFFVNQEGCAITCKHVADLIVQADAICKNYREFQGKLKTAKREKNAVYLISRLEEQYKLSVDTMIQVHNNFVDCIEPFHQLHIDRHPTQDLALLRFEGHRRVLYTSYATFLADTSRIKPGRSLCRLGYPFPEFTNYRYNPALDNIEWTSTGRAASPSFPIDGIVTRLTLGTDGLPGIELSTPGLRGQSGGPLFDSNGLIYGMQSATHHLHLGFDIEDQEVLIKGRKRRVSNYPFLNVGWCVHADVIKAFLREKGVRFYEG